MIRTLIFLCTSLALAVAPEDFGYQADIVEPTQGTAVRVLDLDEQIYKTLRHSDLRDIRITNRDNQIVPHSIGFQTQEQKAVENTRPLIFWPISGERRKELDTRAIHIQQQYDNFKQKIYIPATTQNKDKRTIAYLIDLREGKDPLDKMILDWRVEREQQIAYVSIDFSPDLKQWTRVTAHEPLYNIVHGQQTLIRNTIDTALFSRGFLRLSWEGEDSISLKTVKGVFVSTRIEPLKLRWQNMSRLPNSTGVDLLFDGGGLFPIARVHFEPPPNTLARVAVYSTTSVDSTHWTPRGNTLLYRLTFEKEEIRSEDFPLSSSVSDRYWKIVVSGKETQVGDLVMKGGWYAHRIHLLASGNGPFRIVYGSFLAPVPDFGVNVDFGKSLTKENGEAVSYSIMTLANHRELGGPSKLLPPPLPPQWRKWLLWAALALAIALLGYMALALSNELKTK